MVGDGYRYDLHKYNKDKNTPKLTCAIVFNKSLHTFKSAFRKHWNLPHLNVDISNKFPEEPLITYRKEIIIRNRLGPIHLSKTKG